MSARLAYRPDVDGLRAVAVLSVLFFHANLGMTGGYVGVDIFFVISGFLITSLIMKDIEAGKFSMIEFWERRARRIAPAMVFMVFPVLLFGWLVLLPGDFKELGQSAVAQSVMLSNVYFWREQGYFAGPSELMPLLHTWSLAVEEQFYVLIPPFLYVIHLLARPLINAAIVGTMVLSFSWSAYAAYRYPEAAFFLLPSRAWELLLGALLVRLSHYRSSEWRGNGLLSLAGLGAIGYAVFAFDNTTPFPGIAAFLPCLGTAALIWSNTPKLTLVGRFLAMKPMVFIGLISYSLYLWHWPILAYARYVSVRELDVGDSVLLLLLSAACGIASWKWIETPFRVRSVCSSRRQVFLFAGTSSLIFGAAGLMMQLEAGHRYRFSDQVLKMADAKESHNPRRRQTFDLPLGRLTQKGFPRIGDLEDDRPPCLLVWGDSHADAAMPLIESMCREYRIPAIAACQAATIPLYAAYHSARHDNKAAFNHLVEKAIEQHRSIRHVLLIARWNAYDSDMFNAKDVNETIDTLSRHGIHVWILYQVPEPEADVPRALAMQALTGSTDESFGLSAEEYRRNRREAERLFGAIEGESITIVDPFPFFFPNGGTSIVVLDDQPLYYDDDHLSRFGAMSLKPLFEPMFSALSEDCGD